MAKEAQGISNSKVSSTTKKFLVTLGAAESDLALHPVDTVIKRLQNFPERVNNIEKFKQAVFPKPSAIANTPLTAASVASVIPNPVLLNPEQKVMPKAKFSSLLDGWRASALNKGATRVGRYLTQDYLQYKTERIMQPIVEGHLDKKNAKALYGSIAGVAAGVLETIALQPLETKKTCDQLHVPIQNFAQFYKGFRPNLVRTMGNAGVFFGMYNYLLNGYVNNKENPSKRDQLTAITGAALTTNIAMNPIDVIKTRVQGSTSKVGMWEVGKRILQKEGVRAFTKGIIPKVAQAPAKSIVPYALFQIGKKYYANPSENKPLEEKNTVTIAKK